MTFACDDRVVTSQQEEAASKDCHKPLLRLERRTTHLLLFKLSPLRTMSDSKLRCALVYRLESGGNAVCVAKYDHAGQYETHGGADSSLYGGRDQSYAEAVSGVISGDPPSGLSQSGTLGGFKVVQSDQHQVVYGADTDGLCKSL
jgi:hypothetical protein